MPNPGTKAIRRWLSNKDLISPWLTKPGVFVYLLLTAFMTSPPPAFISSLNTEKEGNQMNSNRNPKLMFIILGAILVIGIGIFAIVSMNETPAAVLAEGSSYEIENISSTRYKITDDAGNVIELKRVNSLNNVVFEDKEGRRYVFVSGSPYKFVKID
jgi:hypothetical protein